MLKKFIKLIKAVLKNCTKLFIIFTTRKYSHKPMIACIVHGGLGDILREKCVLIGLEKMDGSIKIDCYNRAATRVLQGLKCLRFVLDENLLAITKNKYDIIYEIFSYKVRILKTGDDALSKRILKNISDYQSGVKKISCPPHLIRDLLFSSGLDDVCTINLNMDFKMCGLEKFGISKETKYITFQFGYGARGENDAIKCYSQDKWEAVLSALREKFNHKIKIVQVGSSSQQMPQADINTSRQTSLDELCSILKNSLLHIDIDGACMHIATALNTKVLALEGPNNVDFCGYEQNINIVSKEAAECWRKNSKTFFRHACLSDKVCLEYKPLRSCVDKIDPSLIVNETIKYLKSVKKLD
jgi:ADP-heptose:LPS heptosyltransferase